MVGSAARWAVIDCLGTYCSSAVLDTGGFAGDACCGFDCSILPSSDCFSEGLEIARAVIVGLELEKVERAAGGDDGVIVGVDCVDSADGCSSLAWASKFENWLVGAVEAGVSEVIDR
jgi:hypothetical protein